MLEILPSLRFLAAPTRETVSVDRYSPYFEEPERHGIGRLRALDVYRYLYPFPGHVRADIAYAFEYECVARCELPDVAAALDDEVGRWRRESDLGELRIVSDHATATTLLDKRPAAVQRTIELNELESLLYRACRDIGDLRALRSQAWSAHRDRTDHAVDATLASLVERRLMVNIGERYLSLALPASAP